MKERLEEIKNNGLKEIESVASVEELEEVRKRLTGKKSEFSEITKSMSNLSAEDKKTVGMLITEIKEAIAVLVISRSLDLESMVLASLFIS